MRNNSAEIPLEIEIKLRVADRDALRRKLACLRAQPTRARVHEMNTLYDTRDGALTRRGQMIRVRVEREVGGPGKLGKRRGQDADKTVTLTYKGPVKHHEEGDGRKVRGNGGAAHDGENPYCSAESYKVREEREVRASDERALAEVLGALGLAPQFRYEKYRSTYRLPGIAHVVVEFDETLSAIFWNWRGAARPSIERRPGWDLAGRTISPKAMARFMRKIARKPGGLCSKMNLAALCEALKCSFGMEGAAGAKQIGLKLACGFGETPSFSNIY